MLLFLSVDFGTSSIKMAILDENLNIKQVATASYPYILLPGEKARSIHRNCGPPAIELAVNSTLICGQESR
jgi:sugar (pentulose or hexulose) kinase